MRLPPEWAPQSFVLLAWPDPHGDFAPWLDDVEHAYALSTAAISQHEGIGICCQDENHQRHIQSVLEPYDPVVRRLFFIPISYHDIWVRDTAPLSVWSTQASTRQTGVSGHTQRSGHDNYVPDLAKASPSHCMLIDFRFNGWGGKYPCELDDALGTRLYRQGIFDTLPYQRVDWVLEGGSLETDGRGTLLATRQSVQNPNRNPNPMEAEKILRQTLGLTRFLWLDHGHLEGDDTDAHIDTLARFCDCDTIVYQACKDTSDSHHGSLRAMAYQLAGFHTPDGKPYKLLPLPLPRPIFSNHGQRLPASYANFLIINEAVLVPEYDDPADSQARSCLQNAFPTRTVIPIPARSLIHQFGSLHCMTMQYPIPCPCH